MRSLVLALAVLTVAGSASAQTMTDSSITMIRTGWNADSFAVVTAEPMVNPAGCASPDGYISDSAFPGYETYYAAALTAYLGNRPITITVHQTECYAGRPKLIGINLRK